MTTTLHLGVTEIPYSWGQMKKGGISAAKATRTAKQVAAGAPPPAASGMTTGDVATALEQRYALMERFVDFNALFITTSVEHSIEGALQTMLMGGPGGRARAFAQAGADIQDRFKVALSAREFDGRIAGVPTRAALAGIRHRFKNPFQGKRGPRPSFIDTGLFQSSFRCWVDTN